MSKRILLTRSRNQNQATKRVLDNLGFETFSIPMIDIANTSDIKTLGIIRDHIEQFDMFIFVSIHAVRSGINVLLEKNDRIKDEAAFVAVGERTAAELHEHVPTVFFPNDGVGGEVLMSAEEMQDLQGKRVMIIRGQHGKAWLGKEIEKRGGKVDYFDCYRRRLPRFLETSIKNYLANGMFDVCMLHSAHSASNLIEYSGSDRGEVLNCSAVVGSEDIKSLLVDFGWMGPIAVSESPSNDKMITALSTLI